MPMIDSESEEAKRRRSRTNFSQWQLEELERVFQSCHYPDVFMREAMALKLELKESRISVRGKWTKHARFFKRLKPPSVGYEKWGCAVCFKRRWNAISFPASFFCSSRICDGDDNW